MQSNAAIVAAFDAEAAKWKVSPWGVRWTVWPVAPLEIGDLPLDKTAAVFVFDTEAEATTHKLQMILNAVLDAAYQPAGWQWSYQINDVWIDWAQADERWIRKLKQEGMTHSGKPVRIRQIYSGC